LVFSSAAALWYTRWRTMSNRAVPNAGGEPDIMATAGHLRDQTDLQDQTPVSRDIIAWSTQAETPDYRPLRRVSTWTACHCLGDRAAWRVSSSTSSETYAF
jgi:hypothetical protein